MAIFQNYVSHWANFIYDRNNFALWFYFEEYIEVSELLTIKWSHSYVYPLNALPMGSI